MGVVSSDATAREIVDRHSAGLVSRRYRDLLSEKFLLHIDGSGDNQWADILNGERVAIPRVVSEFRKTENLLRPIVDNAIAHHTTMPMHFIAESSPDRRAKETALVDALFANYVAHTQDLGGLFADALYLAMPCGYCPVHHYWREDAIDVYEPIAGGEAQGVDTAIEQLTAPKPGIIDCWLGNPFDTVFDRQARRGSVLWCSYGRVLNANLVRRAFRHMPGVQGLQGTLRIPSAALFQRIARDWRFEELAVHGSSTILYRREAQGQEKDEELLIVVCREVAPGVDANWPTGRLQMAAVPGYADLRYRRSGGHAVMLYDGPLPAGDWSWSLIYSHHRGDDIHGKPWVEDLDNIQVDLNIALSKEWEIVNRMVDAPIVAPGGAIAEDMADIGPYQLLEVEPSLAGWRPRVMEWPYQVLSAVQGIVERKKSAMYTIGGYQASSRGEAAGSRIAFRAIALLQQADNSIHGPVNQRYQRSVTDFMRGCWRQFKAYGDIPWLLTVTGDEYSFLAQPYIDRTQLSEHPPHYKLVNAFGASPELRAQEILQLMGTRGADGQPFLRTDEARRMYPNTTIFDDEGNPKTVMRRRAKTIAAAAPVLARQYREMYGIGSNDLADPNVHALAAEVFKALERRFPRLRNDDLMSHLASYAEVTQDETADTVARLALIMRENLYYQWQAMMATTPGMTLGAGPTPGPQIPPGLSDMDPRGVRAQAGVRGEGAALQSGEEQQEGPTVSGEQRQEGPTVAATAR